MDFDEEMEAKIDAWIREEVLPTIMPGATLLERLDPTSIDMEALRTSKDVKHVYIRLGEYPSEFEPWLRRNKRVLRQKASRQQKGHAKALRKSLVKVVQTLYPSLVELAEQNATSIQDIDTLRFVIRQMLDAPDEATARFLLNSLVKSDSKTGQAEDK